MFRPGLGYILCGLLLSSNAYATASDVWLCEQTGAARDGDGYLVCGVATADTEEKARPEALKAAQGQFYKLCDDPKLCAEIPTEIEALRNSCDKTPQGKIKCHRGLKYSDKERDYEEFIKSRRFTSASDIAHPNYKGERFTAGVGVYQQDYRTTNQQATGNTLTLFTDYYSGYNIFFTRAMSHNYAMTLNGYWLDNVRTGNQHKLGLDAQLLLGSNLNRIGLSTYVGIGAFGERWQNGKNLQNFYGGEVIAGLGFNTRYTSLDVIINRRTTRSYDQFIFGGKVTDFSTTAGGTMIRYGIRF